MPQHFLKTSALMQFSNLFPQSDNLESDLFNDENILDCKPFKGQDFESSSDELGCNFEDNENPFAENCGIFKKLKASSTESFPLNWSRKSFTLSKSRSTLIRSAPLSFGSSVWDLENNGERITLPVLGCGKSDSIKRISGITLVNLLNTGSDCAVIDARFKYEYDGGHIGNALNINNEIDILKRVKGSKIIVFYCEFSSVRGPGLAKRLRNRDRLENEYPKLNYPEIYVLEGGYKNFYKSFPQYCTPVNYIQMHDKRFRKECVNSHKILRPNKS